MSYDFELYAARKHSFEQLRTSAESNVLLTGPDLLEVEDIDRSYLPLVGKRRFLYRIHLEGNFNANDQRRADVWLNELVAKSNGVLIDLQTDVYSTKTKTGKVAPDDTKDEGFGRMSFYFGDGEGFYERGFERMLQCIADNMPKALPQRYGYYEPLQGRVENGDFSALIAAFHQEPDLFMKCQTPFSHIFISVPCKKTFERYHPKHFIRRKFLLGHVSFELKAKLFSNPSLLENLQTLFTELCLLLDVTYAEIVKAYEGGPSWLWYGLPDTSPESICIGKAYQSVWPEISNVGRKIGRYHRIVSSDRFGNTPPKPPVELIAPDQGERDPRETPKYAKVFPFEYHFDRNTYIW